MHSVTLLINMYKYLQNNSVQTNDITYYIFDNNNIMMISSDGNAQSVFCVHTSYTYACRPLHRALRVVK